MECLPCKTHQTEQLNNDWIPCEVVHIPERRILSEKVVSAVQNETPNGLLFLSAFIFRSAFLPFRKTEKALTVEDYVCVLVTV